MALAGKLATGLGRVKTSGIRKPALTWAADSVILLWEESLCLVASRAGGTWIPLVAAWLSCCLLGKPRRLYPWCVGFGTARSIVSWKV